MRTTRYIVCLFQMHDWHFLADCLSAICNWFCHNGVDRSGSESDSVLFESRTFPSVTDLVVSGSSIHVSSTYRILGVV